MSAFALELGLGVLLLSVFAASLAARGEDRRWIGWLATLGVLALAVLAMFLGPVDTATVPLLARIVRP